MIRRLVGLCQGVMHGDHASYQVLRHLAVGGSGVIFNWVVFSALRHFSAMSTLQCTLVVHVFLLVIIFPLQKLFTFKDRQKGHRQAVKFLINDVGYMVVDYLLAVAFIDWLGLSIWIGKGCGLLILTPLSFVSQRFWVFSEPAQDSSYERLERPISTKS